MHDRLCLLLMTQQSDDFRFDLCLIFVSRWMNFFFLICSWLALIFHREADQPSFRI